MARLFEFVYLNWPLVQFGRLNTRLIDFSVERNIPEPIFLASLTPNSPPVEVKYSTGPRDISANVTSRVTQSNTIYININGRHMRDILTDTEAGNVLYLCDHLTNNILELLAFVASLPTQRWQLSFLRGNNRLVEYFFMQQSFRSLVIYIDWNERVRSEEVDPGILFAPTHLSRERARHLKEVAFELERRQETTKMTYWLMTLENHTFDFYVNTLLQEQRFVEILTKSYPATYHRAILDEMYQRRCLDTFKIHPLSRHYQTMQKSNTSVYRLLATTDEDIYIPIDSSMGTGLRINISSLGLNTLLHPYSYIICDYNRGDRDTTAQQIKSEHKSEHRDARGQTICRTILYF